MEPDRIAQGKASRATFDELPSCCCCGPIPPSPKAKTSAAKKHC